MNVLSTAPGHLGTKAKREKKEGQRRTVNREREREYDNLITETGKEIDLVKDILTNRDKDNMAQYGRGYIYIYREREREREIHTSNETKGHGQ